MAHLNSAPLGRCTAAGSSAAWGQASWGGRAGAQSEVRRRSLEGACAVREALQHWKHNFIDQLLVGLGSVLLFARSSSITYHRRHRSWRSRVAVGSSTCRMKAAP